MHSDSIAKSISDVRITSHEYKPEDSNQTIPYRRVTLVFLVNGTQQQMHLKASREQLSLLDIVASTIDTNTGNILDN